MRELGLERPTFEQARVFHAQNLARQLIAAGHDARRIAEKIAAIFPPHNADEPFDVWWQLEEAFTCNYCRDGVGLNGQALEHAIREEAQKLVAFDWRTA